jgi:hypothetical protein
MDQPQPDHILQVGLGFWASKTLLSAVEMGVFTELAKHPADLETLQGRLGLHYCAMKGVGLCILRIWSL